ncbi:DUF2474 domain-containing protein [Rahnella sp. LAC-M12]
MDGNNITKAPFLKRVGWMAVIWSGSVLALFVVATVFHLLMFAAGMREH